MSELLHVAHPDDLARADTHYRPAGLSADGFVHCCDRVQLPGVLQRFFTPGTELVLLRLDAARIDAAIVHQVVYANQPPFAHVHGPIPVNAIIERLPFTAPHPSNRG